MPLDPQFTEIINQLGALPAFTELPLDLLRSMPTPVNPDPAAVDAVSDRTIPGPGGELNLRIYRSGAGDALPLLVFMHGGGFVLGNLDSHDDLARRLTAKLQCVTVAVDYRLAPENPFPAAVDDCYAALNWAADHAAELGADVNLLTVIGDSAGANLAAVMALRARDAGAPALAAHVMIYPAVDLSAEMKPAPDGNFYMLSPATRAFFNGAYLRDEAQLTLPYVSPLMADDLRKLPPALMITAEYDPLCEQGEAYAAKLKQAGVDTTLLRYDGAIHGFATFPVPMQRDAVEKIAQWLSTHYGAHRNETQAAAQRRGVRS